MTEQIFILLILLLLSGLFSSAETALFSISRTRARHLAKLGGKPYELIRRMKSDPHRLLTTILIGNNVANIGASALATSLAIGYFHSHAVGLTTGIMTFLILVFGEVIPKSLATQNNILVARLTILPIYWLSVLFFPIIAFLNFIPKITGKITKTPKATEEELMTFVEVVEEEGVIKEEEKKLIHNIFEFDDTSASEIMTPRADMFVIEFNRALELDEIIRSGFTRIPVIERSIDNVIGIINIKDLFLQPAANGQPADIRKIMMPAHFIPENIKLDRLLKEFKKRKQHMAIVVDEHGGVSGLITLEDVLEELVGEIRDETDKDETHIVVLNENEWLVMGKSDIDEVNEKIPLEIPDTGDYDTISGYILDKLGRIPKEKELLSVGQFTITVKEVKRNRIRMLLIQRVSPCQASEQQPESQLNQSGA